MYIGFGRYWRYIGNINQYISRFVSKLGFIPRVVFVTDIVSDISVIYRQYIADIDRYSLIFPSFDFCLLISCQEGPTPEMSTIYHDISVPISNIISSCFSWLEVKLRSLDTDELPADIVPS